MCTVKPHSNGPYSSTVIGTVAVDGWAVRWTAVGLDCYAAAVSLYDLVTEQFQETFGFTSFRWVSFKTASVIDPRG